MTDLDLDQIEARYNDWYGRGYDNEPLTRKRAAELYPYADCGDETRSHYIVRNDLPALVDEVRRLRETVEALAQSTSDLGRDLLIEGERADAARAEAERQRERADHNAAAVNENADEIVRLRAEADELRRLLLDETYRPEGVEIVMRELNRVKAERDALRYQLSGGAS